MCTSSRSARCKTLAMAATCSRATPVVSLMLVTTFAQMRNVCASSGCCQVPQKLNSTTPMTLSSPGLRSDWIAFPGNVYSDAQCRNIRNAANETVASCATACNQTPGCNAMNAHSSGSGACALRQCACSGVALTPSGNLSGFTAYFHINKHCAPPPLFANVFGSAMVLQRGPLRARVFGSTTAKAALTVTLTHPPGSKTPPIVLRVTADAAGEWECLLPATAAGGPYQLAASVLDANSTQTLSGVMFGDVFICGGQSNMELPVSLVNNASAELQAGGDFPWIHLAVVESGGANTPQRDLAKVYVSRTICGLLMVLLSISVWLYALGLVVRNCCGFEDNCLLRGCGSMVVASN
eukprot:m.406051 g.406051  ORF g.406051 m.406051 type:complete len:352 (-) comp21212_c1_seq13:1191-2246(-)